MSTSLSSCGRAGLFLALLSLTGGCVTDSCETVTRDVTASTAEGTSSPSGYAQIHLSQDRGGPGSLFWVIQGPILPPGEVDPYPYRDHVLAARLLDVGADTTVLLDLPVQAIEGSEGIGGVLLTYSGPIGFEQLFALVNAGGTVLDVTSDIPGQERMLRPLDDVRFTDWRRIPCGD